MVDKYTVCNTLLWMWKSVYEYEVQKLCLSINPSTHSNHLCLTAYQTLQGYKSKCIAYSVQTPASWLANCSIKDKMEVTVLLFYTHMPNILNVKKKFSSKQNVEWKIDLGRDQFNTSMQPNMIFHTHTLMETPTGWWAQIIIIKMWLSTQHSSLETTLLACALQLKECLKGSTAKETEDLFDHAYFMPISHHPRVPCWLVHQTLPPYQCMVVD